MHASVRVCAWGAHVCIHVIYMCLYVWHAFAHLYVYVYGMHVCYVSPHACMRVCVYACMRVCAYACMHVCVYACMRDGFLQTYVHVYVCARVCTGVCKCIRIQSVVYVNCLICKARCASSRRFTEGTRSKLSSRSAHRYGACDRLVQDWIAGDVNIARKWRVHKEVGWPFVLECCKV
jgi:hypothetical protein